MNEQLLRSMGWWAYVNGALTVVNMITLALMFAVNPLWGPVNDAISVPWVLSFVPLALLFGRLNRPVMGPRVALGAAVAGISAMVAFAWLQGRLAIGLVRFEETLGAVMTLGGVLGLWLLVNGLLALAGQTLPGGLAWLTVGFGLSFVVAALGYGFGGYQQPLLWVGAGVGYLIGPVWALWLGRLLLDGRWIEVVARSAGN
jgi:hypothetical protein